MKKNSGNRRKDTMLDLLVTGGSYPDFDAGVMKQANIGVAEDLWIPVFIYAPLS